MSKPKMTPLAVALRAIEPLSDEEKQTVRDMLRPAPKPRQKGKSGKVTQGRKRVAGNPAKEFCQCGKPLDDNVHQLQTTPEFHDFKPASEASKGVGV